MQQSKDKANSYSFMYTLQNIKYHQFESTSSEDKSLDYYVILVITAGSGTIMLENVCHPLSVGSGLIIDPGETFFIDLEESSGCYQLKVGVTELNGASLVMSPLVRVKGKINCAPLTICLELLETIYKQRDHEDELCQFQNHIKLQEFLLFIFKQNQLFTRERDVIKDIEDSIDYLKQNYQHRLTIDTLASMANISRWQYTKLFKEKTGQVPSQYLNQIRVEKAKQMLLMSNYKLHTIADHVGYSNEYYFNRRFKQTVGITPGQYRRNHQTNIKVFAPYLEDFLLALGITPVAQSFHTGWGKQNYLNLIQTPTIDITLKDNQALSAYEPDFIMFDEGIERWISIDQYEQLAPTYKLSLSGEQWRERLRTIADLLSHTDQAEKIITEYEWKANQAKQILSRFMKSETVACLRISAHEITLYAGPDSGYTGPILYKDLGLKLPSIVKHLAPQMRRVELSLEDLKRLDADHLFITLDYENEKQIKLLDEPAWQSLSAVQKNQVYEVDFFTWMNYGVLSHFKKIDDVMNIFA